MLILAFGFENVFANQPSPDELFAKGNLEYQQGNYGSAIQYYSRILDSGADSGSIYYNLGNACFKEKKLGEAIYYWEKARQKMPADREIRENLELASLLIVDRITLLEEPLPLKMLAWTQQLFTIKQETLIVLFLFIVANILLSLYLLSKNFRISSPALWTSFVAGLLFIIFATSLSWKIYERDYRKNGIIIEAKVDVRSGPGPENITVFTVHEGLKVQVHENSNGWSQISLPNGWNGWIRKNDLRIL
jgi:tetratricopeptide (TPR) repeat protein